MRRSARIIAASAIVLLVAGCAGDDGDRTAAGGPAGPRGRLVIGMQQEPEILCEALNTMVSVVYTCNFLFGKFVKHDDRMQLVPDLVREIPTVENGLVTPDHLSYTYRLRRDVFWHDGTPLTAADVVFSWRVMTHPEINVETRQGWDVVERIETPDSFTVVFHLREVYANFVGDCFYDESVLPAHVLRGHLGPDFAAAPAHRAPVGSGPFVFREWVAGSHIRLEANPRYYGEGPGIAEIVLVFVPDGNALLMQLEAGEIDAIDNAPNALLDAVSSLPGVRVYRNPALFNEHLDLNCEHPILSDRRVRRALALAVDRKEISEKIYDGVWIPAWEDDHPSSPYHTGYAATRNARDPSAARRLLDEAGWRDLDGDGIREKNGRPLSLEITATTGRINRERTQVVLREQCKQIGVDLSIRNHHPTVLYASWDDGGVLKRGEFDIALYAFLSPPDPSTKEGSYSADYVPPAGQNHSRIRDEELTRLLALGSATIDENERRRIYGEVSRIIADEVPIIPLLWVTQLDAMPRRLRGYRPNATQSGDTWNAAEWRLE